MNILLLGSGGREHALAKKITESPNCQQLFIAPGNAGTATCGTNLNFKATDFEAIRNLLLEKDISMVVVGPEDPLVKGIYDFITQDKDTRHVQVIGPSAFSAQLEGSKSFAKSFMARHAIPTASYREFTADNFGEGLVYISGHSLPIVLKADGLAAGKGVLICSTHEEAAEGFKAMIQDARFGEAGKKVVIESYLKGIEVSVFVLTDGQSFVVLPEAKDYKRVGEGDTGLNTGGMGAVSPVPFFDDELKKKILERIVWPTIKGLQKENMVYKGFIFLGLMVDNGEPYMIEYNCRMGDPETEVVIPRITADLVELFKAVGNGTLAEQQLSVDERTAVTTIAVSGGYPGEYVNGKEIFGLEQPKNADVMVYHAGTTSTTAGVVTNGGRVLAVTAFGNNIKEAADKSREALSTLCFEGMYYRRDIGYEFD